MTAATILVDRINDRDAVALWRDGQLDDLLIDPPEADATPRPGAIYRVRVGRPMKGMHGAMVTLPDGARGFLRDAKGLAPGAMLLVQVSTYAEPGKAPPVTQQVLFKSRFAIVTPNRPGINIARAIRDEDLRAQLQEIADEVMAGADPSLGLILRSNAALADPEEIAADIAAMRQLAEQVLSDKSGEPTLLVDAPCAIDTAWRDWPVDAEVVDRPDAFETHDIWGAVDQLGRRRFDLGQGAWMQVDPTAALVAVDINTGTDQTPAAADKANRAAIRALPRALRLLGLGGMIMIDFAPLPKRDRRDMEAMLKAAFRADSIDTTLAGWSNLGLFEAQRKRERRPIRLEDLP